MVGVPITIQDSSFRFSMGMVQVRIGSVASFGVMVLLLAGFLPVGRIGVDLVGLIFFGVIGLAALFSRKLGCTKLHQANAEEQTLQLLADVRGRKKSRGGVMILKCEDSFWREIVSLAIQHADAVVIDITELSQNVIWELQTALAVKSPQNILLAYENDEGQSELPPTIAAELQAAMGKISLHRFTMFCYPRRVSRIPGKKKSFLSFRASQLREALTRCISHSSASVP